MAQNTTNTDNNKKKKHPKQIAAIIGILLLMLLYIATLISALVDSSATKSWFRMCLFRRFQGGGLFRHSGVVEV